ncbi:MAG: hypothetical protein JO235_07200 [Chroococcidiopsidaceae cyanobacterium CP_BM_RX_35]|nr:hypothetical protein [Chroococcidiopsidaceae cyanobacterium CP_BM_RX_35]
MSILPNFLRSVLLTIVLSFIAPVVLLGGVLIGLVMISYIPGIEAIAQSVAKQIQLFLAIFGSGNPFRGLGVIGITCSLVGALFDTYTFYRYQSLRDN